MSRITVSFVPAWVSSLRANGVRVVRQLEKWVASLDGVTLKASSGYQLTVELPPDAREKFVSELATQMREVFGESEPWAHVAFGGDVSGLAVPSTLAKSSESASAPPPPERRGRDVRAAAAGTGSKSRQLDPLATLEAICGRVPFKHSRELTEYVRETAAVIPTLQKMGVESSLWHQHLLLAVDAGYGRSEFLASLAQLYQSFGLVKADLDKKSAVRELILVEEKRKESVDGYRVTWEILLNVVSDFHRANTRNGISKVVLYIDISAWQDKLDRPEVKARLRQLNSLCGSFLLVFRVPFLEGHVLRKTATALNDILNVRTIVVPPPPLSAMVEYARNQLKASGFEISEQALGAFEQLVLCEKQDDSFFGYKTMDKVVQKVIYEKALSNCRNKVEDRVVGVEDLKSSSSGHSFEEDPSAELEKLVGMSAVARRLREIIVQIQTQRRLSAKGKKVAKPSIHMVFSGNPGTGKTTVARILARMMQQAGILRKGHLVEVKGRDLCGEFVGETAPKTSAICRDAYGSVLFIDEAYSLFRNEFDSARDYGREALDTLVAEMENHRDDFCVIMAGYKDDMAAMLKGNVGLKSRIPFEIEFPNYTRDDLEKIFFTMLDGNFDYESGLRESVREFFANISEETFSSKEFSNARLVRNLYERTWGKAAYRQSLDGGELRILKSDLAGAMADSEFTKLMTNNVGRRAIGFGS